MIKLQVIGNLGKDCVLNNVNGKNVINFNVAHTEKYKDAQGVQKDKTIWVECAYWTDRTGVAPYLKKGTQVYVEGTPDMRTYTGSDGKQGASLTLRIFSLQLIGGRGDQQNDHSGGYSSGSASPAGNQSIPQPSGDMSSSSNQVTEPLDDLPF